MCKSFFAAQKDVAKYSPVKNERTNTNTAAIILSIVKMTEPLLAIKATKKKRPNPIANIKIINPVIAKAIFNISFIPHFIIHSLSLFNLIINYNILIIKNQPGPIHFCTITWSFS